MAVTEGPVRGEFGLGRGNKGIFNFHIMNVSRGVTSALNKEGADDLPVIAVSGFVLQGVFKGQGFKGVMPAESGIGTAD